MLKRYSSTLKYANEAIYNKICGHLDTMSRFHKTVYVYSNCKGKNTLCYDIQK